MVCQKVDCWDVHSVGYLVPLKAVQSVDWTAARSGHPMVGLMEYMKAALMAAMLVIVMVD